MVKRILALSLLMVGLMGLSGCGDGGDAGPAALDVPTTSDEYATLCLKDGCYYNGKWWPSWGWAGTKTGGEGIKG